MSTEKKIPPIQPAPVQHFTVRLVDGHFVRIPKLEYIAVTDATRPPTTLRQESSPHGDGEVIYRNLRLVNGRFVSGTEPAPVQIPPTPVSTAAPPAPAAPIPEAPPAPSANSWAYAFGTRSDPSDSSAET